MDECELEDIGQTCAGTCINTIGSFRCSEEDGAEEDVAEEESEDEREAEAIQEAAPSTTSSTQRSTTTTSTTTPATTTTTTTTTSTAAPTTTTTATTTTSATTTTTVRPEEKVPEATTIKAITPVPVDEIEEEEGEDADEDGEEGEQPEEEEPEERENRIDNNIAVVETKETAHSELDETCPDGFLLADRLAESEDGSACQDVDECAAQDNFGCSHLCVNTQGSAHCDCPAGWKLKDDRKTCRGNIS